jgi:glucose-1-phosphate thymidylyltransferase
MTRRSWAPARRPWWPGTNLGAHRRQNTDLLDGHVFACQVGEPTTYGLVEFDQDATLLWIEQKPVQPKPGYAVPGS